VKLKDWPLVNRPESHPPADEVEVCGAMPLLVQVTVAPTGTVTLAGWKAKSMIETADAPCA
jgi:hypothetical protein